MANRPRIFAPHKVKKDLSGVRELGVLKFLSESKGIFPDLTVEEVKFMVAEIRGNIRDYMRDGDYLLLVGDPAVIFLCGRIVAECGKRVRLLKYDRQGDGYYEITIPHVA